MMRIPDRRRCHDWDRAPRLRSSPLLPAALAWLSIEPEQPCLRRRRPGRVRPQGHEPTERTVRGRFQRFASPRTVRRQEYQRPILEWVNAEYVQVILMNVEKSRLSGLLASHPLEVHAGRNQLQPLLVAVTDREALHAWRLNATCCAAPHTVRTRRRSLLHLQVREFSGEASIVAVLCSKLFNLPLTLFPVQFGFPWCKSHNSGMHSGQGRKLSVMELKPTDLILRTRVDESVDTIRTSKTQYLPMAAWRGRAGAVR